MEDDEEGDLERLVRKGIRRVRIEDDSSPPSSSLFSSTASAQYADSMRSAHSPQRVAHGSPRSTHVSQYATQGSPHAVHTPNGSPLATHMSQFSGYASAFPQRVSPSQAVRNLAFNDQKPESPSPSASPTQKDKLGRAFGVLLASLALYFSPLLVRALLFAPDINVAFYQYLLLVGYFAWTVSNTEPKTGKKVRACDLKVLLKHEREMLKQKLAVHMDRQHSYWHYPNYHIPIQTIQASIETTNQELLQVELLISKVESGRMDKEKEYHPILDKVINKYGVKAETL